MEIQTALDHTYPKFKSADVPEAKAVKRNVGEVAEGPAGTTTFMRQSPSGRLLNLKSPILERRLMNDILIDILSFNGCHRLANRL